MKYSDIVRFDVQPPMTKRLGYKKMFVVGKNLLVLQNAQDTEIPQVIISSDPGVLINGIKDINVIGIIFDRDELTKRVLEKASEYKKILFVPVGQMIVAGMRERGPKLGRLRKIIFAAHKLGVEIRLVTMASDETELLSLQQLEAVSRFLIENHKNVKLFGEII